MRVGVLALSLAVAFTGDCQRFAVALATGSRRREATSALHDAGLPFADAKNRFRAEDFETDSLASERQVAAATTKSSFLQNSSKGESLKSAATTPRRLLQRVDGAASLTPEMASVVKIFVDSAPADFEMPWQRKAPVESSGSGFVVEGRRIITNAHVVADQTRVLVRKHGNSKRYVGKVIAAAHDVDLALLTVEDESFFEGVQPLQFGDIPPLQEKVVVVGYPTGGDQLSVTEGVVSRTGISTYAHSSLRHLTVQIDAAINPGNSGGPAICGGLVVGVAFQGFSLFQNLGYIIPAPVVQHFLADLQLHGRYTGVVSVGAKVQNLENEGFKKFVGLRDIPLDAFPPNVTPAGVYVLSVEETHIQNYFTKTIKIPFSRYPALGGGVGASSPPPRIASTVQEGRARVKEVSKRVLWPSPSQPDEAPPAPSAGQGEGEEETEEQSAKRRAESSGERKAALPSESEKKKKTKKTEEEETEETSLGGELLKASHKAVKSLHVLTGNAVTEPPPSAAASAPSLIQRNQNLEASDAAPASESASPSAAETEADAFFPVMTEATLKSIARVQGQEEEALSAESPSLSGEAAARSRENPAATGSPSLKASEKFATSQMRLRSLRAAADRLMGGAESAFANNSESTAFPAPEKNNQQPPTSVKTDDAPPSSSSRSELERKAPPTEGALPASEASEENNSPQPAEAGAAASQEGGPSSAGASHDEARELEATPKKREESEASASDKAISSTALNESQRGLSPLPQRIANPYYDKTLEAEKEFVGLKKGDVLLSLGAFDIADDGTIAFRDLERVSLEYAVTEFFNGQTTYAYVLRDKKIIKVTLPLSIAEFKVPPYTWDRTPPYFVFGGFVFTALSKAMLRGIIERGSPNLLEVFFARHNFEFKKREGDQVVVLSMILASEVSLGYDQAPCEVVSVNGERVRNLRDLVKKVETSSGDFITLRVNTVGHTKAPLVIDRKKALAIHRELLKRHLIPADRSPNLEIEDAD